MSADGCSRCLSDDEVASLLEPKSSSHHDAQLDRHLAACPDCRDLVRAACLSFESDTPEPASRLSFCTLFEPGMIVARRYCIKRLLGRGGMGEVYEAVDLIGRTPVALKTLRASTCDDERARARLLSEFRVGRRIGHQNVCRMLEVDSHCVDADRDAPIPFFTMQLVPGVTLRRALLARGAFDVPAALRLGGSILRGLAALHAAQVVHRDLKSDNILLDESAGRREAVIVDFGLARHIVGATPVAGSEPTGPSGSLGYMAPEQVLGQRQTPAADVFSFGVILFEALMARLPFGSVERGRLTFATRQIDPSLLQVSGVLAQAPRELDAFVVRCLAQRPEQRFADGAAALEALRAFADCD